MNRDFVGRPAVSRAVTPPAPEASPAPKPLIPNEPWCSLPAARRARLQLAGSGNGRLPGRRNRADASSLAVCSTTRR
jgi:hypothetical protein